MNIEIVSGSPRKNSVTHCEVLFLQKYLADITNHSVNILDVREYNLSVLQQQTFKSVETTPYEFQPLAKRMFEAQAFVLVTPEYNGSYTPALKNLFDHFPKQHHKAFGIVTASSGALGGIRASQQMQLLINALFGVCSPYMLITPQVEKKFDTSGFLTDEAFRKHIELFIVEFLWLAECVSAKKELLT